MRAPSIWHGERCSELQILGEALSEESKILPQHQSHNGMSAWLLLATLILQPVCCFPEASLIAHSFALFFSTLPARFWSLESLENLEKENEILCQSATHFGHSQQDQSAHSIELIVATDRTSWFDWADRFGNRS